MSGSGVIRTNGLDGVPHVAVESSRRRIEREDVAFANANRPRLGWQTIANIRGVNMHDLRRACDQAYLLAELKAATPPPAPAIKPAPPAPCRKNLHRGIDPFRALAAIAKGAASYGDLMDVIGCGRSAINNALTQLKRQGLLAGHARSYAGWVVTDTGHAALRKTGLHG